MRFSKRFKPMHGQHAKTSRDPAAWVDSEAMGEYFREIRKEAGYSMWELSKAIGCAVNEIEQIERGRRQPMPEAILFLERRLGIPMQATARKGQPSDS